MTAIRSALLLCGSPKGARGSSWRFGAYLCDRLAAAGIEVRRRALAPETTLLADVRASDLLLLTFPLYGDGVPARMKRALMRIAAGSSGPRSVAALVNCGFLESRHTDTAVEMCRLFAREAGLTWLGGLGRGGGGALGDKDLAAAGGLFTKTRRSLDLAAEALAAGRPIPPEAVALMREDLMPRWLYMAFANVGHFVEGTRHGLLGRMNEDPFGE
ncbi:MAG TPA: hypothetical protein VI078_17445 [bacterium]